MSSLEKMLGLLDVFTSEQPIWSSEDLIGHLGSPASTCYRYLKVLHTSGYLARVGDKTRVTERLSLWQQFCSFHGAPATFVNLLDLDARPLDSGAGLALSSAA